MNSLCATLLLIISIIMTTTTPKMIICNKPITMITALTGVIEMRIKTIKIELKHNWSTSSSNNTNGSLKLQIK